MFRIERDSLYSLDDLRREFEALGMDARTFLDEVHPPKLFRSVWRGADILTALDAYVKSRQQEKEARQWERIRMDRRGRPAKRPEAVVENVRTGDK